MSCYAIKISRSTVSVSTTTGCVARLDGGRGCEDQRGPRGRDTPVTGSFSFRIYEVTKMTAVGCSSSSTCTPSFVNSFCGPRGANCDGRSKSPHITFMQSALPCDLTKPPVAPETWKQIFPAPPIPEDLVRDKKANANNMAIKEANKINIKENGNFLGIPGDIEIKTDIPAAEPLAINKVKNVGLFLTQNKTNNTPKFLAFKQMIQDLSTTLPEHYNVVIPVPTGNPVLNCEPPTSGNQQCIDGGPTQLTVTVAGIPGDWAALNGSYTFELPELLRYPPGNNQPSISLNRVVGNVQGYPLLVWLDWGPSYGVLKAKAGLNYDSGIPGSFYFNQTMENARDSAVPFPKCSGIELYDCSNAYLAPGKTSENGTVNYIDFSNATISIS